MTYVENMYEDINSGMFWNGIPVMTWRAPEGPDARRGNPPEEQSGDTFGFYQIKGGVYMVEMLPVLPCALRIVRTTTAHFSTRSSCFRIILKAGPLIPADTWNKSFLSFLSQQMYGPWGWNLMGKLYVKKRYREFLVSFVRWSYKWLEILKKCRRDPGESSCNRVVRRQRDTDGHRKVGTTDLNSCFLIADSFQYKHEEYAILLEMKFAYFSRILEQNAIHCKGELGKCWIHQGLAVVSLTSSPKGLGQARKRNCLRGGGSRCRKQKKNHNMTQCTFNRKEGSDDISLGKLKLGHCLTGLYNPGVRNWPLRGASQERWGV